MLRGGMPHAVLISGPANVGKTTFAEDLAAGLLCVHADADARPCGACRGCRALRHGNHPDLHRLAPVGPGAVIPIGGREERGVRDLVRDLALLPVEGGALVDIIVCADRMTEDAQSALLKTLEEPPAGTILLLTAADEERLLPTIRSRCVRIRLGPVSRRDVEEVLVEGGHAEAPVAARLARLAAGRPGDAVALARAPEAITIRSEVGRTLLDLTTATRTDRLRIARDLLGRTAAMASAVAAGASQSLVTQSAAPARARPGRTRGRARAELPGDAAADGEVAVAAAAGAGDAGPAAKVPASERRAAALSLIAIWRDVARDLALVGLGQAGDVRQLDLLDDLEVVARRVPSEFAVEQLRHLELAGERLEGNVSPELVVDALALGWAR